MGKNYKIEKVTYYRVTIDGKAEDFSEDAIQFLEEGFLKVLRNDTWHILNPNGRSICHAKSIKVFEVKDGMMRVYDEHAYKYTFVNVCNGTAWPFAFDYAEDFENGVAKVVFQGKVGFATKDGKFVKN